MSPFIKRWTPAVLLSVNLLAGAGCFWGRSERKWLEQIPFINSTADNTAMASLEYVFIERPAGTEDINRKVWDRVDESVLPYETRMVLNDNGMRVGIVGGTASSTLSTLMNDPRTDGGHRMRRFPFEKTVNFTAGPQGNYDFTVVREGGNKRTYTSDRAEPSFKFTVTQLDNGQYLVKILPAMNSKDQGKKIGVAATDWDKLFEPIQDAEFEVKLGPTDYLVIGTDYLWPTTFGRSALIEERDERQYQRLLVLRPGQLKDPPSKLVKLDPLEAPPLAVQTQATRASRP